MKTDVLDICIILTNENPFDSDEEGGKVEPFYKFDDIANDVKLHL